MIGNPNASFEVWLPHRVIYHQLKEMKQNETVQLMTVSYVVQNMQLTSSDIYPFEKELRAKEMLNTWKDSEIDMNVGEDTDINTLINILGI